MLAVMDLVTVHDFADIEPVLEQMVERAEPDPRPTYLTTTLRRPPLGPNAIAVQFLGQRRDRTEGKVALIYMTDGCCLGLVHDQPLLAQIIAECDAAAHE